MTDVVLSEKAGIANKARGQKYHKLACAFLEDHPIGTSMSQEDFSEWAQSQGLLQIPTGVQKDSPFWLAHLQQRHQIRHNINRAATHPRMHDVGKDTFEISSAGHNQLQVRSVPSAIAKTEIGSRVESLIKTKHRQLGYLMQSADWGKLPEHEQAFAEALYDDIDLFEKQTNLYATDLSNKFRKLEYRLKQIEDKGDTNGGIKQITEGPGIEEIED